MELICVILSFVTIFVTGSLLDILDGALARAGGKTTPFGAFLDSTTDRMGEGFMLTAIAYILATQDHPVFVAVAMAAVAGSVLVSCARAPRERSSGCAATWASAHAPRARRRHHGGARPRTAGRASLGPRPPRLHGIITVSRGLHIHKQLVRRK